jgi:hypothetical protein
LHIGLTNSSQLSRYRYFILFPCPVLGFIRSFRAKELQPCFVNRKREENK